MTRLALCVVLGMFAAARAGCQPVFPDFEVVLLPLAVEQVPGAFGTIWTTQFSAYHDSDLAPVIVGYDTAGDPVGIPVRHTYSARPFVSQAGDLPGALLYVSKPLSAKTRYELRIKNAASGFQTNLPVVREDDLLVGRVVLLRVPGGTGQRRMLRVYAPLSELSVAARVRIADELTGEEIAQQVITLMASGKVEVVAGVPFRVHPTAAQVSLEALFPSISTYQNVTVIVEPLDASVPIWAFVAATNNVTQEVTLMVPN